MFSFFPQNVRVNFPTSSGMLHLWLEVRWSPTIEDDFLSDLDLPAVELVVGASKKGRHSSGVLKSNGDTSGTMLSRSGSLLSVRKVMDVEDDRHRGLSRALQSGSSSGAHVASPSSQERKDVVQPEQNGSSRAASAKNGSAQNEHAKAMRKLSSEPMFAEYGPDVVARSNTEQTGSPRVLTSHVRTKRKTSAPNVSTKASPPPTAQETLLTSAPPPPEGERLAGSNGSLGKKHSYEEAISFRSALSSSLSADLSLIHI